MTALTLERLVRPSRSAVAPRIGSVLTARTTMVGRSIQAARELDNAASPTARLRVLERFSSSIAG